MNVNENLLFQMYQMMDRIQLPEINSSETGKDPEKSSFQDLMDQARQDTNKTNASSQRKDTDAPEKTQPTDKTESTDRPEQEQPKLENTNYSALSYLLHPELLVAEEPVQADGQELQIVAPVVPGEVQQPGQQTVSPELSAAADPLPQEAQPQSFSPAPDTQQTPAASIPQGSQTAPDTTQVVAQSGSQPHQEADLAQADTSDTESDPQLLSNTDTAAQPVFHDVEDAVPVKVGESYQLDTSSPDMDADLTRLIDDAAAKGLQRIEIQLTPEHLGKVVVELTQNSDGALQVVLHAANAKSSSLLSQHLDSLSAALQNLGHSQLQVQVERNQDSPSAQQHPFQQADPDGHGQQQGQQQHRQTQSDSDDFLQQLRLGLFSLDDPDEGN